MNVVKVLKMSLISGMLSVVIAFPVLAGTWTQTITYADGVTKEYEYLWAYIKDDGNYAQNEWIQDVDATWYWLTKFYTLPLSGGVSDDGYLFDSKGRYVPMDGRFFLTPEGAASVSEGMSYEQVVSVLGIEHERLEMQSVTEAGIVDYVFCYWYYPENKGDIALRFENGIVTVVTGVTY